VNLLPAGGGGAAPRHPGEIRESGSVSEDSEQPGGPGSGLQDRGGTPVRRSRGGPANLGGLERMVGYAVRRAQMWMIHDLRRALKSLDLTPAQFSVLRVVAANPGISQARVAEALAIERARLVQMIDRLEAMGRVLRTRSPTDRRSHALYITAAGSELVGRAQDAFEEHERNVLERLGARDKDELMRILAPFITWP
jgi:DNA-binding MarR family transcriptional regulator